MGKIQLTKQQLLNADVNADGEVNTIDSLLLQRFCIDKYPNTLPTEPITDYVFYGDVIEDGVVRRNDKALLARYFSDSFNVTLNYQQLKNADINGDGKVNKVDSIIVNRSSLSKYSNTSFPFYII